MITKIIKVNPKLGNLSFKKLCDTALFGFRDCNIDTSTRDDFRPHIVVSKRVVNGRDWLDFVVLTYNHEGIYIDSEGSCASESIAYQKYTFYNSVMEMASDYLIQVNF
jgi:hypothetical protein